MGKQSNKGLAELGKAAKRKLYLSLLKKIGEGESLSPTELRNFNWLSTEFDAEQPEGEAGGAPVVFQSYQEAAEYAGIKKTSIHYHVKRGRIKVNADGKVLKASLDEYLATRSKTGRGGDRRKKVQEVPENLGLEKELADLRYRLAKADKEEITAALLKGRAYFREDVIKDWSRRVALVKAGLIAFADRLPPLFDGKSQLQIREILQEETIILLESFASKGKYTPAGKGKK